MPLAISAASVDFPVPMQYVTTNYSLDKGAIDFGYEARDYNRTHDFVHFFGAALIRDWGAFTSAYSDEKGDPRDDRGFYRVMLGFGMDGTSSEMLTKARHGIMSTRIAPDAILMLPHLTMNPLKDFWDSVRYTRVLSVETT